MQKLADWMAGVERSFDGKVMGMKNKSHTALKFFGYSAALLAIGAVIGKVT